MKLRALFGGLALAAAMAGPTLADDVTIGFITKFPVSFYTSMVDGAKAYAAANPGVKIIYGQGQSGTDIDGQIALIESMITQGVKGIAITPVDPTVAKTLDKAVAAGIKVVLMDNSIPNWTGASALATTDNLAAGKIAGAFLKTQLKDGDKLGILQGVPGVPALDQRVDGMMAGLDNPKVVIAGKNETDCDETKGINAAQDLLTANPDITAIYSACGPPAAGAAQAIKTANLSHKVLLVGFDWCCGERDAMKGGIEIASVAQNPFKMAQLGVDALLKAIKGEKVESVLDSGAGLVTPDNMDSADFKDGGN